MEKIRISYKGNLKSFNLDEILKKLESDQIKSIEVGRTLNLWQDSPLNYRIEFRNGELFLVVKSRKQPKWEDHYSKLEGEEKIELFDLDHFIRLYEIFKLGEVATTLAVYIRIDYKGYELYIRHSSELGYFWEIAISVEQKDDDKIKYHKREILNIIEILDWSYWDEVTQSKVVKNSKFNLISAKYSLKDGWSSLRERISKYLREIRIYDKIVEIDKNLDVPKRIVDALYEVDNDYSLVELFYKNTTQNNLTDLNYVKPLDSNIQVYEKIIGDKTCSIITPFLNDSERIKFLLKSIDGQDIPQSIKKGMELIIVDDGSSIEEKDKLFKLVEKFNHQLSINIVNLKDNRGRSNARNIGGLIAKGEILFFIDSDIVLPANYILENLFIQCLFPKVITVSMKENVSLHDERLSMLESRGSILPKDIIPKDFRLGKNIYPEGRGFNKMNHDALVPSYISCIDQTNYFRNFGNGTTCGVWELSHMVITHNTVVSKDGFVSVGGFSTEFKGWGLEDSFFGAKLISKGYYVIPSMKTPVLHINHPVREQTEEERQKDFVKNAEIYKNLISREI